MKKTLLILFIIISGTKLYSQNKPGYPEPKTGYKRVDLILPKIENEENYKVEVRFGMIVSMNECEEGSFSFILNNLKTQYGIPPSRFPYYILENSNGDIMRGKKSGCDSNTKIDKKILSSQNIFIGYQSYYPRPFYIPESWTLEYRIWEVNDNYISVDK